MSQRSGFDRPAALTDKELEAGAAILGNAEGCSAARQDRDVAAVAAPVEHPKTTALANPEVERVLDDDTETGGFHRNRIMPLISKRCPGSLVRRGMIMLVIGEALADAQIAMRRTTRGIERGHADEDAAGAVNAHILNKKIAERLDTAQDRRLVRRIGTARRRGRGEQRRQQRAKPPRSRFQNGTSNSIRHLAAPFSVARVRPNR